MPRHRCHKYSQDTNIASSASTKHSFINVYFPTQVGFSLFAKASIPIFLSSVAKLAQNNRRSISNPLVKPSSYAVFTASFAAATARGLYPAIVSARSKAPLTHSLAVSNTSDTRPYFNASSPLRFLPSHQ
jgi:hypothetical protein